MAEDEDVTPEGSSARQRIEESLQGILDKETLDVLLREVLAITKSSRGWCSTCKRAVTVQIPDAKAVVAGMGELINQASGRTAQQQPEGEQAVHISYRVVIQNQDGTTQEVLPVEAHTATSSNGAGD